MSRSVSYSNCIICDRVISYNHLTRHVTREHGISPRDYYHQYIIKSEEVPGCAVCGKPLEFQMISEPYDETCSRECWKANRAKQYSGEGNPFHGKRHSEDTSEKMSQAALDRGYVPHPNMTKYLKKSWEKGERDHLGEVMKEHWKREEYRNVISYARREQWKNPEFRNKVSSWGNQGFHESPKAGKILHRSSWELRYFMLLDSDPDVIGYKGEPFPIPYEFEGRSHNYYPDILIIYSDGRMEVVEIKPEYQISYPQVQVKLRAGESFCLEHGYRFRIITERSRLFDGFLNSSQITKLNLEENYW